MKLEIKHLVPYLPYGIPIKILNYKCDYVGIEFANANGFYMMKGKFYLTYEGGSTGKGINDFKPILMPFSENNISENDLKMLSCGGRLRLIDMVKIKKIYLFQLDYLLKHHFDIFDLIPAGIALNKLDYIK